jgi:hypothetical protein
MTGFIKPDCCYSNRDVKRRGDYVRLTQTQLSKRWFCSASCVECLNIVLQCQGVVIYLFIYLLFIYVFIYLFIHCYIFVYCFFFFKYRRLLNSCYFAHAFCIVVRSMIQCLYSITLYRIFYFSFYVCSYIFF